MAFRHQLANFEKQFGTGPLPNETSVTGELLHVIFSNPESGYGVARLRREDQPGEIMVAGTLNGAMEGMMLELTGHWVEHPEHGRQFQVTESQAVLPKTKQGILRYLASGIIPGISKRYAAQIVNRFGLESLNIIDNAPDRLKEIRGFGEKRVEQIKSAWVTQHADRDAVVFLQGFNISPALCKRIIARYTAVSAPEIIRRNPYRLASEVDGIGFLTADRIAASVGISKDSPLRLSAAALYCLEQASTDGHTALPPEQLVAAITALLQCDAAQAQIGIDTALRDGKVIRDGLPKSFGCC